MNLSTTRTIILCLLIAAFTLIIPTGAVHDSTDEVDDVWGVNGVVLAPSDGPNEAYAEFDENGNLSVDLSSTGVNVDAETVVKNVFVVANDGNETVDVWFTHAGDDRILLQNESRGSIQGNTSKNRLAPNQETAVTIVVDTVGRSAGDKLIEKIHLHAEKVEEDDEEEEEEDGGGILLRDTPTPTAAPTPTPSPTPTLTPSPPATPVPEEQEVTEQQTVKFDDVPVLEITFEAPRGAPPSDEDRIRVRELTDEEFDELDAQVDRSEPKAIAVVDAGVKADVEATIEPEGDESVATQGADQVALREKRIRVDQTEEVTERITATGADAMTLTNEDTTISGTRSILGESKAINRDREVMKAVDIEVPANRRNAPAMIRLWAERDRFDDSGPQEASIGHLTDDGWQVLPTRVVRVSDDRVVFETKTPGFSPFAVFAENEAEYTWEVAGETTTGQKVTMRFSDPGIYDAELTVTDSFGQSDTATTRVLVNDPPDATIRTEGAMATGGNITLHAEITNEVGAIDDIRWEFDDGTTATGGSITRDFDRGEHDVTLIVRDEYGAVTEIDATLSVGNRAIVAQAVDVIPALGGLGSKIAFVILVVIPALLLGRRLLAGRGDQRERAR